MYSFVGRRSTTAVTTAAAAARLGVTTYMVFLIFVLVTFLRVLYNIHHVNQRSEFHTYSAEVPVLRALVKLRLSMTCGFVNGQGKRGNVHVIYRPSCRSPSLILSCLTVSFSCVVYSRGNRKPGSEKKQTSVSHQTENEKKKSYTYPHTRDLARSFEVDRSVPWQRAPPLGHV